MKTCRVGPLLLLWAIILLGTPARAQNTQPPRLYQYTFATSSSTATLTGYYVDASNTQIGAVVSYTITTTPTTFTTLAGGVLPDGAVGFVGTLSAAVLEGLGGNPDGSVTSGRTPAVGSPVIPVSSLLSWGRVPVNLLPTPASSGSGGGGGAVTIADGASVTLGAQADAAWSSGSGSVVAILKGVYGKLNTSVPGTNLPSATGGVSTYCFAGGTGNALLTSTVVQVGSTAAHSLYGIDFVNTGSSAAYVQIFDLASGSVVLGTTVPKIVKWIPAGGGWEEKWSGENRLLFSTAISFAATTTPTGSTAPSTALLGNVEYL